MKLFDQIHARLGDLWWYTILLFVAQRIGDIINMFVGLWLVPKCVGPQDLGAVLPLTQLISLVGLPLGIVATPFMKYLTVYAEKGEYGKVKALLRDVFLGTAALAVVTLVFAWLILPFFFERVRVAAGSLGFLIVLGSVLAAVSTIFGNAVQGLKLYNATVWFNLLGAPFRLVTMLVAMPFRALSGYFAGQCAPYGVSIVGAVWVLRKRLGRAVQAQPYWREDGGAMIRYTIPLIFSSVVSTVTSTIETLVIRHRLSDFESAGYYILTRFTDIASYFGSAFIVFLFPMVAGLAAGSRESKRVVLHSIAGTTVGGLVVGGVLAVAGGWILSLSSLWATYTPLKGMMFPICVLNVLLMVGNCLTTYKIARGEFRFFWYLLPLILLKGGFLYAVTGVSFFHGMVPESWIALVESWQPCRLSFVIATLAVGQGIVVLSLLWDVFFRGRPRHCCRRGKSWWSEIVL